MDKGFALFGKLSLGIVIAAILVAGGIYLGTKEKVQKNPLTPTPTAIAQSPSPTPSVSPVQTSATPSAIPQTVSITGTSPFSSFIVTIPAGWQTKKETIADKTRVTFSGGTTSIVISQAAGDASKCIYPGDTPADFSSSFNTPIGITGNSGQFRRATATSGSVVGNVQTFTVCQMETSGYQFPTEFGYITYQTTPSVSDATLSQLDQIVASLKKQ